ncbi:hypothetical protein PSACC_00849 [Paramicrosporidium saccamoebae]|uniref:Uncharacterized protein n=1 Tax=Paramicrosporidium saccamoebae TaxID=1246581 RepID=A0A2H9TNM9_9FUNG|nr:hypothetical protein PSACC_00849 [Paramicrosporidium saccamoebae]
MSVDDMDQRLLDLQEEFQVLQESASEVERQQELRIAELEKSILRLRHANDIVTIEKLELQVVLGYLQVELESVHQKEAELQNLRAELARQKDNEMQDVRAELVHQTEDEMRNLRAELALQKESEIQSLRAEMAHQKREEVQNLRSELARQKENEMQNLRAELVHQKEDEITSLRAQLELARQKSTAATQSARLSSASSISYIQHTLNVYRLCALTARKSRIWRSSRIAPLTIL